MKIIYAIVAIALVVSIGAFAISQSVQENSYTQTTIASMNVISHTDLIYGVVTIRDYRAMNMSMKAKAKNFRVEILTQNQTNSDPVLAVNAPYEEMMVANYIAHGAKVLGVLGSDLIPIKIWTLNDWNSTIANELSAYPTVNAFEIQNEPWNPKFQSGYSNGNAIHEFYLIASASNAIRAMHPKATVVCFGGASIADSTQQKWYKTIWNMGASQYCNAISLHAYTLVPLNSTIGANGFTTYRWWSNQLDYWHNMTQKPIWITETGYLSNYSISGVYQRGFSNKTQLQYMRQSYALFNSTPYVKRVYWFVIRAQAPCLNWGGGQCVDKGLLNNRTYAKKPAWYQYVNYSRR
ncbi:MAG: glycosyl hydrolase [Candidatus Micrarchaeales archaeon]